MKYKRMKNEEKKLFITIYAENAIFSKLIDIFFRFLDC